MHLVKGGGSGGCLSHPWRVVVWLLSEAGGGLVVCNVSSGGHAAVQCAIIECGPRRQLCRENGSQKKKEKNAAELSMMLPKSTLSELGLGWNCATSFYDSLCRYGMARVIFTIIRICVFFFCSKMSQKLGTSVTWFRNRGPVERNYSIWQDKRISCFQNVITLKTTFALDIASAVHNITKGFAAWSNHLTIAKNLFQCNAHTRKLKVRDKFTLISIVEFFSKTYKQ